MKIFIKTTFIATAMFLVFTAQVSPTAQRSVKGFQTEDTTLYAINQVTQKPEFEGGKPALIQFLVSNVKYPKVAELGQIQGVVLVEITMEKNGKFTRMTTINKPFGGGLEQEALRVMRLSEGKWSIAKNNGLPVRIKWVYPIKFSLY
jgi:protein TonB